MSGNISLGCDMIGDFNNRYFICYFVYILSILILCTDSDGEKNTKV